MSQKVLLNRGIYPAWAIEQAIADYAKLASIETYAEKGRTVCCFSQCRYDEELTVNEFLNYLVDLLNNAARA